MQNANCDWCEWELEGSVMELRPEIVKRHRHVSLPHRRGEGGNLGLPGCVAATLIGCLRSEESKANGKKIRVQWVLGSWLDWAHWRAQQPGLGVRSNDTLTSAQKPSPVLERRGGPPPASPVKPLHADSVPTVAACLRDAPLGARLLWFDFFFFFFLETDGQVITYSFSLFFQMPLVILWGNTPRDPRVTGSLQGFWPCLRDLWMFQLVWRKSPEWHWRGKGKGRKEIEFEWQLNQCHITQAFNI